MKKSKVIIETLINPNKHFALITPENISDNFFLSDLTNAISLVAEILNPYSVIKESNAIIENAKVILPNFSMPNVLIR